MKIALIILLLLIAVLLIPVKVWFRYDGEAAVDIKYLFFKKSLLPKKPAAEKGAKGKEGSSAKKQKKTKPDKPK